MSTLTKKERESIHEHFEKVESINKKLHSIGIYDGDKMYGRMNDGTWTEVIFSGINPDSPSPFYTDTPDGQRFYFDRLGSTDDSDALGTDKALEQEWNEAHIHSWY